MSLDNWLTQQIQFYGDQVLWTLAHALADISSREDETYLFWDDQAALYYRQRFGNMRRQIEEELMQQLNKIHEDAKTIEESVRNSARIAESINCFLLEVEHSFNMLMCMIEHSSNYLMSISRYCNAADNNIDKAQRAIEKARLLLANDPSVGIGIELDFMPEHVESRDDKIVLDNVPIGHELQRFSSDNYKSVGPGLEHSNLASLSSSSNYPKLSSFNPINMNTNGINSGLTTANQTGGLTSCRFSTSNSSCLGLSTGASTNVMPTIGHSGLGLITSGGTFMMGSSRLGLVTNGGTIMMPSLGHAGLGLITGAGTIMMPSLGPSGLGLKTGGGTVMMPSLRAFSGFGMSTGGLSLGGFGGSGFPGLRS